MIVILDISLKLIQYIQIKNKKENKKISICSCEKKINPDDFNDYMKEIKPDTYIQTRKLICDWSDKKNSLIQYRMLKFRLDM